MTLTAFVVAQMMIPAQITQTNPGTSMPSWARASEIVSEIPVAPISAQAIPKLISIVM